MQLTKKKEIVTVSLRNGREDCWSSWYVGKSISFKKILKCHYNKSKRKNLSYSLLIFEKTSMTKIFQGTLSPKNKKQKWKTWLKKKNLQLTDGQIKELNLGVTPVFQMICIYARNDLCFHHIFVNMWSNNVVNSTTAIFNVTLNSYKVFTLLNNGKNYDFH